MTRLEELKALQERDDFGKSGKGDLRTAIKILLDIHIEDLEQKTVTFVPVVNIKVERPETMNDMLRKLTPFNPEPHPTATEIVEANTKVRLLEETIDFKNKELIRFDKLLVKKCGEAERFKTEVDEMKVFKMNDDSIIANLVKDKIRDDALYCTLFNSNTDLEKEVCDYKNAFEKFMTFIISNNIDKMWAVVFTKIYESVNGEK